MAKHLMFDIDGTLIQSTDFDEQIFIESVETVSGLRINTDWQSYPHVTDTGLLQSFCQAHQREDMFDTWHARIKARFIEQISLYCQQHQVSEVPGSRDFIRFLQNHPDYIVSFATGGWFGSAKAKLENAGFDADQMVIFSSDDHFKRTEIMKMASASSEAVVYFGDGEWDKRACQELNYGFIAVGDQVEHQTKIINYLDPESVLKLSDHVLS